MTTAEIVDNLRRVFPEDDVKIRPDGYSYISQEEITSRLLDATGGIFDFKIERGPELASDGKKSFWMVVVTLTIPGLGSRTHVGTAQLLNEDSPKAAVTDAFKKCCTMFGCGLQLYEKPASAVAVQPERSQAKQAGHGKTLSLLNESGAQCTGCRAPDGKPHAKNCPSLQGKAA